jgi:Protein of unknown function (DUF402)
MTFAAGSHVLFRQVWRGLPWLSIPVEVVDDAPELLVLHLPNGAPFGFHRDHPLGAHPWSRKERFDGNGVLMLQRPGERYAIWHFWDGPERRFRGWYVNFQEPFRRRAFGFDTQDQELDLWLPIGGEPEWKDVDLLAERVRQGRFSQAEQAAIHAEGNRVYAQVAGAERWWDPRWSTWAPDGGPPPELPEGWHDLR